MMYAFKLLNCDSNETSYSDDVPSTTFTAQLPNEVKRIASVSTPAPASYSLLNLSPVAPESLLPVQTSSVSPPQPPASGRTPPYTSTGALLPLPPKKKDIYRPYELPAHQRPEEDLHAAHAILDLSQPVILHPPPEPTPEPTPEPKETVAYTYDAFFVSDGRSKRRESPAPVEAKAKYTCGECGKRYATSSNLSRHKQTHRSLDSVAAKRCPECGKAYVSMPALAMHVLTHRLAHVCGVCGKLFSRPWLLQGHLRSHTGEKPYGCAHCGKAFADRSNLRAHMQTHSSDKNFECGRCRKSFALKSYLNKHQESSCVDAPAEPDEAAAEGP